MDVFSRDLLSFGDHLNRNQVKYSMVGEAAINFHRYIRATDDMDIWTEDSLKKL